MNKNLIKQLVKSFQKMNLDGLLITNNDKHLNENTNLQLKIIYHLLKFDSSFCYLIILKTKIGLFTDGRYLLQAKSQFKKQNVIIKEFNCENLINFINSNFKNGCVIGTDPEHISIYDFKNIKKYLFLCASTLIPVSIHQLNKNKFKIPNFNNSQMLSLPKSHIPRSIISNIEYIKSKIKSDALLVWDNAQVAYILNIRSFEINNSTKPFAGLLICKKGKNILISNNNKFNSIKKINKYFHIFSYENFFKKLPLLKLSKIEVDFEKINLLFFQKLRHLNIDLIKTKTNLSKFISKKTNIEIKNINKAQFQDGLAVNKFFIYLYLNKKKLNKETEFSLAKKLETFRKHRVNFFKNSFDYISAFGANASIIHYKPTKQNSLPFNINSIYLIDSGAHYLEGTTDVTRVLSFKKTPLKIKNIYTFLVKSLIKIEQSFFNFPLNSKTLDKKIRSYLAKNNIFYPHGTGHGVGYFNDVHERPPVISKSSVDVISSNNFFSLEPGFYIDNNFGLRLENLYFSKKTNGKIKLINTTLIPYEMNLINKSLLTIKEKKHIINYHSYIYNNFKDFLSEEESNYFNNYYYF